MQGIYAEELAMLDGYEPDITRESPTLLIPWEGWTDTDQPTAASMCTAYIQTGHLENDAEYTQTMSPSFLDEAPQELPILDTVTPTVYTQPVSIPPADAVVDPKIQPQQEQQATDGGYETPAAVEEQTATDGGYETPAAVEEQTATDGGYETPAAVEEQTATDWGYEIPAAVVDEPTRLNKRGLPMRHSAMQVEERVKSIARWENATEDSVVVREIASAIDQEITRESSRKRIRLIRAEADPVAYDSEMSDGADGNSECEQDSEPDTEEPDTDFVVADEDENDEHGEDVIDDDVSEHEDSEDEEDSSEDDLTMDEESEAETETDGLMSDSEV
ncbi:hypothetical protein T484DRAFT_1756153 [Baffinella frigidus]|nr:hypothetical protein T484DRAFT_1756153 [Cryptophyta sp. CCMP2293]